MSSHINTNLKQLQKIRLYEHRAIYELNSTIRIAEDSNEVS